jgi:hypothetical protein
VAKTSVYASATQWADVLEMPVTDVIEDADAAKALKAVRK